MNKLFTNDKFFLTTVILSIVGNIVYIIPWNGVVEDYLFDSFCRFVMVLCLFILYYSYKNHDKNVMKGMMGALLMGTMLDAASTLSFATIKVFAYLYLAISAAIFITHFLINSSHKASPVKIRLNQILVVLLLVVMVIWDFMSISVYGVSVLIIIAAEILGFVGLCASIVCIESRLDAYRLDREESGWTEEKGYPKGYIHEFEKK